MLFRGGSAYSPRLVKAVSPSRRSLLVIVLLPFAISAASAAHAAGDVVVSLDFETDPALAECPSAADFRKDVIRQLGHDPFRDNAPRRLVVRIRASGARMGGRVEWRDASDEWEGERTFSSRNESCAQMARAMALATAIQIQLLARFETVAPAKSAVEAPPPAPPAAAIEPVLAPPVAAVSVAPPAAKEPVLAVNVGAGVIEDFGNSPAFVVPRIAVSLGRPSALGVRLAVSGLGPGAKVTVPEGVAELDRFVMTLELIRFFRSGRIVQPLLAVGAGWQMVRAHGTSAMPALAAAHEGRVFSGLVVASGGVAFSLATRLSIVAEVEALFFSPAVTVQVASAEAAHLDGASLFAHGGLLARF